MRFRSAPPERRLCFFSPRTQRRSRLRIACSPNLVCDRLTMSRQPLDEFIYSLTAQDPDAIVLMVEGVTDQRFFAELVPLAQRSNASVILAAEVEVPVHIEGGERERLVWLAHHLTAIPALAGRLSFFIDADHDRFSDRQILKSVISTDFSDFKSYVLNRCSLSHILYTFDKDLETWESLKLRLIDICRPIKKIRVASALHGMNLPINRTLGDAHNRMSKYMRVKNMSKELDENRLKNSCASNAQLSKAEREKFDIDLEQVSKRNLPDEQWVHGKDLIAALGQIFDVSYAEARRHVHSALRACINFIQTFLQYQRWTRS